MGKVERGPADRAWADQPVAVRADEEDRRRDVHQPLRRQLGAGFVGGLEPGPGRSAEIVAGLALPPPELVLVALGAAGEDRLAQGAGGRGRRGLVPGGGGAEAD